MNQLSRVLRKRLEQNGLSEGFLAAFLRDFTSFLSLKPDASLEDLNRRLRLMGWNDLELDDHTFQLIIAVLEANGVSGWRFRDNRWYDPHATAEPLEASIFESPLSS